MTNKITFKYMIKEKEVNQVNTILEVFYDSINPIINFGNRTSRKACEFLIKKYGFEETKRVAELAVAVQGKKFAPVITTPYELKEKLAKLGIFVKREGDKKAIKVL